MFSGWNGKGLAVDFIFRDFEAVALQRERGRSDGLLFLTGSVPQKAFLRGERPHPCPYNKDAYRTVSEGETCNPPLT